MSFDINVVHSIRDILISRHESLSAAESVTAGHIQAAISAATQASRFFQGGITVYNGGQKSRHLGIEPIQALEADYVSEQVACQMALGANKLFLSNYSVAVTGYATTMPEKNINELFAYFAIAFGNEVVQSKRIDIPIQESVDAQKEYTRIILLALNNLLTGASDDSSLYKG